MIPFHARTERSQGLAQNGQILRAKKKAPCVGAEKSEANLSSFHETCLNVAPVYALYTTVNSVDSGEPRRRYS
jgi:hypothetical protein